eukprot:TRINITY_DN1619_c0_g1_i1.p1 TRINITY_DN1619_c0_g1~~TRINITY_DN1619_c0_g1_i1.p1  ORF type:complete len:338 (+),score=90.00 TRINITY_DN1619_c0_g1_i1:74-1087(+)
MSHSSGIPVSEDLKQAFGKAQDDSSVSYFVVHIEAEKFVEKDKVLSSGNMEHDFNSIPQHITDNTACYVIFRLNTKTAKGDAWALVLYVPDLCTVREKMVYASSRENLRRELGASNFTEEFHATLKSDITFHELEQHKKRQHEDIRFSVMTETEKLKQQEQLSEKGHSVSQEYVHGVQFPFSAASKAALESFKSGAVNWVELLIDPSAETIELGGSSTIQPDAITNAVSASEPRFYLHNFVYTQDTDEKRMNLFIFSCPDEAPVKLKMLFSTTKAAVLGNASSIGLDFPKKFEIRSPDEISEEIILDDILPKVASPKSSFQRPQAPGRGGARLIRKR